MPAHDVGIAVIGAGIVGLACAYYLSRREPGTSIAVIDPQPPMSLTSAASGENYRNWWPHPVMTAFTDHSIDLLEAVARATGDRIHMTRRGYALATRSPDPTGLLRELHAGYGPQSTKLIRIHDKGATASYRPAMSAGWEDAPDGVDVLQDRALIREAFPSFDPDVTTVLHIRRAGHISSQQLGSYMLEQVRSCGGSLLPARVTAIERSGRYTLYLAEGGRVTADIVVNAAGPHVGEIAAMLGEDLPVVNTYQQKIAFPDEGAAIPRRMPFAIDLDGQAIDWTEEERSLLREDADTAWLAGSMPGGIHCRPDGGDGGTWIKLGWAYNTEPGEPGPGPHFPEIVVRGASRLNPALRRYYGRLPRAAVQYGGYYTRTAENWPLIGPMRTPGAFVAGALSGFGTMAACAAGALCAAWVGGGEMAGFAPALSLSRYGDAALMATLRASASDGVL